MNIEYRITKFDFKKEKYEVRTPKLKFDLLPYFYFFSLLLTSTSIFAIRYSIVLKISLSSRSFLDMVFKKVNIY